MHPKITRIPPLSRKKGRQLQAGAVAMKSMHTALLTVDVFPVMLLCACRLHHNLALATLIILASIS